MNHRGAWLPKLLTNSWKAHTSLPRVSSNYAGPLAFFWWQAPAAPADSAELAPASSGQTAPEAAPSAKAPADPQQAEQTAEKLTLGEEVLAVWTKRDALLDSKGLCCSPLEVAPVELVRLERELIRMEFLARSVSEITRPMFRRQLQRIESEIEALSRQAHTGRKPAHALTAEQRADLASRVHSIAMRTQLGTGDDEETKRLTQLSAQLLAAAEAGDWTRFQSVAGSLSVSDRNLEELGWAGQLAVLDQNISSDLKLRSYQVRAFAAELVASAWQAFPWIHDDLQSADRMRLSAERILIDGFISGTEIEVRNLLDRAASEYLRLQAEVGTLNRAASSLEIATTRLPAFIEWTRLVSLESRGPAPRFEELLRLAELCREVRGYLQNRNAGELPQLAKAAEELERLKNSLSERTRLRELGDFISKPHLPGEPRQWEALLQTPLLRADERAILWNLIDERELDFSSIAIPSLKTEVGLKPRPFTTAEQHALDT
ncbi:MAG TPA: hypothetical protein VLA12_00390, partial [Planctomycetaceae bacterium]|nr:hypothetical protein [Planctomycetaceae bacterium]